MLLVVCNHSKNPSRSKLKYILYRRGFLLPCLPPILLLLAAIHHALSLAWRGNCQRTDSPLLVSLRAISHKVTRFVTSLTPIPPCFLQSRSECGPLQLKHLPPNRLPVQGPSSTCLGYFLTAVVTSGVLLAVSTLAVEINSLIPSVFILGNCCRVTEMLSGKYFLTTSFKSCQFR